MPPVAALSPSRHRTGVTAPYAATLSVLFLCTGNSARSIIAETILNHIGDGHFRAYSADSHPKGEVGPHTLRLLRVLGHDTAGLRSKSWDEFSWPGAPEFNFIFGIGRSF